MRKQSYYKIPFVIMLLLLSGLLFADILTSPAQTTTTTTTITTDPTVTTSPPSSSTVTVEQVVPVAQDDVITHAIQQRLTNDTRLTGAHITVITQNGTVSLMGSTTTAEQIAEAIDVAKSVPGVREVKSALTISGAAPPIQKSSETTTTVITTEPTP